MKPLCIIQNWNVESPGLIADYLNSERIPFQVVRTFENQPMPAADACEAVIVLGYPQSVNQYLEHDCLKTLFAFMAALVRRDTPLLGICFGGQMLAKVLGANVERNAVREIGRYPVQLTDEGVADPVFTGIERQFDVFQWHADTFHIPYGATLLATGETCRNQAFRKGNAVGIQFHVEPTVDEVPLWCDEYAAELAEERKTKDDVVADYTRNAEHLRKLSARLVANFLNR
jgi:GMP synthase (glutamine-hydrolysing)